jgi:hypothetical protein
MADQENIGQLPPGFEKIRPIPEVVRKYLVKDEIVDEYFELKSHSVFASAHRLFIKNGDNVKDISYAHISTIELQEKRR